MRDGSLFAGLVAGLLLGFAGQAEAGGISGQITDASSGTPLPGVTVRIDSVSTGFVEAAVSDAFGVWQSSSNLPSGNYRLRTTNSLGYFNERYNNVLCVGNCSTAGETLVAVTDPAITVGINFGLARGGSISGRTLDDSTGLPADTFINVYNSAGTFVTQTRTVSGGTGAYRTEGLSPGTYFLLTTSLSSYVSELYNNSACVLGCSVTSGSPVTIAGTATVTGIDFSLTQGGLIGGTVTSTSNGAALSGVSVKVYDSSGVLVANATSAANGAWSLPSNGGALKPGSYYALTSNSLGYGNERFDDQVCASPTCDPLLGTPIVVTAGSTTSAINFALSQASQIAINAGDRQSATAGSVVFVPPSVIVRNASNEPVAGIPVTFAVGAGGGSITGATQVTNASGIATVGSWTLGTKAGVNTLTATSPGLSGNVVTFAAMGVAGVATQMEATQVWTTGGPLGTARARVMAIDPATPSTLYVGTESAGVFKTIDGGASWFPANAGGLADARVLALAIDPLTPTTLYAGTDLGVFKSTDGGGIWTAASTGLTSLTVQVLAVDPVTPSRLYAATTSSGGLFKSSDSGATWVAVNTGLTGQEVRSLAINPANPAILYVATLGTGSGVFKSTNAGATWAATNSGLPAGGMLTLAIDPVTPSTLYVGTTLLLFKSTDSGASWGSILNVTVNRVVLDPSMPSTLYTATNGGVSKSVNGGATWVSVNTGITSFTVYDLVISPTTPSTIYAAMYGGGGVFRTTNSGASWAVVNSGLNGPVVNGLAIDHRAPSTVYAAAHTGVFKSIDSNVGWTRASSGLTSTIQVKTVSIHPETPTTLYACLVANGGIIFNTVNRSTDSGLNWTGVNTGMATTGANAMVIHPTTPSTLFAGSVFNGVFKSTDSAANWVASNTGLTNLNVNALIIDATTPTTLYAGTNGGVFKSTNSAGSWTAVNSGLTNLTVRALAITPSLSSTLYAGTSSGLFKSVDAGVTWTASNTGLTSTTVNALVIHPTNPSILYAGTETGGVFMSSDAGATWSAVNSGLEITKVRTLLLDPSGANLYAGLHTAWRMPTAAAGDSQTAAVGTAVAIPPSVIVRDVNGNPVSGVLVTFAVASGGGSVSGETQSTNALGIATVGSWVVGPIAGSNNNTLTASSSGLFGSPITFTASGSGATQIALNAGNNQSAQAGSAVAIPPSVIVTDGNHNPVSGVSVTFQVGSGGGNLPFNAASIATGYAHSCALTTSGGVKCWGSNTYGQLGDGTTTRRLTAVDVQGLSSGVASISIGGGGNHTCVVTTGGAAKCWGRNSNGQLGDGTSIDRALPVGVTGMSTGVARLAAANSHTCALTTEGGVKCWGAGASGALGDGTTNSRTTPVDVSGLSSGVASLAAGLGTSCAVTTGGGARCWGNNGNGQLGDGTTTNRSTPVDVSGLTSGVSALAGGDFFTCALTTGGGVKCWGSNSAGRLGHGAGPDVSSPTDVTGLTAGARRIATGVAHACVVTVGGGVKCWGINGSGGLGDGTTTSRDTPVDVAGLGAGVVEVSASWVHSCALTGAGRVKCFGGNGDGDLGDGTTISRPTAVNIAGSLNMTRTTDGSGIAAVDWMLGPTAGTGNNSLTATSPALTGSPVSFIASGTASVPTQVTVNGGNNQTATAGTAVASAPSVRVVDAYGNAVAGVGVTFAVATGGGSVTGPFQTTNASGVATVGSWTLGTTAGASSNTMTATAPGLVGSPLTFTASSTAGTATQIAISAGNNQTAAAGTAVPTAPSVIVRDANNNPVSGASVTFAAAAGGGSVTGSVQTTNASGIATVGSWTLGTVAGVENSLTATATALSGSPVIVVATPVAGPATQLVVATLSDTSAIAGTQVARIPTVVARDAYSNPVAGVAVTFTVTGGGSVIGGNATTGVTGNARVESWTVGTTPGINNNSIVATAAGLSGSPITFTTSATPPPTQMARYGGDGQTAGATQLVPSPASVIVKDANGDAVSGIAIAFSVSAGGGTLPSGVIQAMGGGHQSCALMGSGGVKCWGTNAGDGQTARSRMIPVDVTSLDGIVSLSLSSLSDSTCGVTAAGGAKCWGANSGGLGDGVSTFSSVPVAVQDVSEVESIATGTFHSCVITNGGGVKCWGSNGSGQVGDGTTTPRTTAVGVPGLASGAARLALGGRHTCALTTSGGAKCWGDNRSGQLGDGTTTNRRSPVDVSGLTSGVLALAAGDFHTCALLTGGDVKCWGSNGEGRLGDGTLTDRSTPVSVVGLSTGANSVSVGYWHSCATLSSGGVKCWGRNTESQLGDGTQTNRSTPTDVLGLGDEIAQLSAGGFHNCVLTRAATVKCWGYNGSGRLGDGTSVERSVPVDVVMLGPGIHTTDGQGIARVLGWTLGSTAGTNNNTLTATSAGLTGSPLTFTASSTAGAASQIAVSAGNNQTATAGTVVSTAPSVIVRDANNNPVSGASVMFAVATGGGSLTGATQTTNASGVATVGSWTLGATAGTSNNTLTATSTSLTGSPLTFTASATAGAATQIAVNAGNNQTAMAGGAVPTTPSVIVKDANGNPVSGVSVTFAVASGGGSLTGASQTTNAAGLAIVGTWTLGTTAGTNNNTLTATAAGLTGSPVTFTATATVLPVLSIKDVSAKEGDSGVTAFTFSVTLAAAGLSPVTVSYATQDGTASAGSDYTAMSGALTFAPGETSKSIAVQVLGDTTTESNEAFGVMLSGASAGRISRAMGQGTIIDDDASAPVTRAQPSWQEFFAVDTLETPYVGDFNGDRKVDIITFTRQNPNAIGDVYVALSDGVKFGANTKWHDFFAISTDESVIIGDFNGDGKDDIATWLGKTTRQVYVALSTGSGMLAESAWADSIGADPTDLILSGDANGDGQDDLIAFARKQGKVYVAISDGTKFGNPTVWHGFFAVSTYERPRLADVNGDGKADIVTFATDSPTAFGDVYVATSDATQFVGPTGAPNDSSKWHDFFAIRPTEEIRIGDLNGDSKDDFFTFLPPPFAQAYSVLSQGTSMADNALWAEAVAPLLGAGDNVYVGDVNGDGKADIIIFAQKEGKVFVSLAP